MREEKRKGIETSEFYMWRAIFAFSLVDNILSLEEQKLLQSYLNSVPFSQSQIDILKQDFKTPQNVEDLYRKITEPRHKERFCVLARALVWSEGDMDKQEELILRQVGCLGQKADDNVLTRSRYHPDLKTYHQHYAKAGMGELLKTRPSFKIHA